MSRDQTKVHSVKYNLIMNAILNGTQVLFPLITFPYISRVLGAEGNGKVSFATSVAYYFMMVASLGIPTYGIRACARVRDDKDELSRTVQELLIIGTVMTALVSVIYFASVLLVPRFAAEKMLFYINGINVVLGIFGVNWVYQALEQYDYITARSVFFKLLSLVLMFALIHKQSDYVIYGAILVLATVGSNILNLLRLRRIISFKRFGEYDLRRHLKPVFTLFAQSLAISVYTNLDTVMLGFMKTDVDVGYYNAAVKVKTVLVTIVASLGNVLLPRMSYYAGNKEMDKFRQYVHKAINLELLMGVAVSVYFTLFSAQVICFLAGAGYDGAILPMQIITVTVLPIGLTTILGIQVLTSLEKEALVLRSVLCGAIVDFVLNLLLIPGFAASGAAFATTVTEFVVLAVQMYYTKDLLREIRDKIRAGRYILLGAVSGLLSCPVLMLHRSVFLTLMLSAAVYFTAYLAGLFLVREPVVLETADWITGKFLKKHRKND